MVTFPLDVLCVPKSTVTVVMILTTATKLIIVPVEWASYFSHPVSCLLPGPTWACRRRPPSLWDNVATGSRLGWVRWVQEECLPERCPPGFRPTECVLGGALRVRLAGVRPRQYRDREAAPGLRDVRVKLDD